MAYWGNIDRQNNAPIFTTNAANGALGNAEFGTSVYGVDATEAAVADKGIAPGWVKVKRGMGALSTVVITDGGTLYDNADSFAVVADSGANVAGNVETDANGTITSVTISNYGGLFLSTSPTVTITTSTGSDAVLTATVTGRAGRIQYETLVAMNQITSDASDDTVFPDA